MVSDKYINGLAEGIISALDNSIYDEGKKARLQALQFQAEQTAWEKKHRREHHYIKIAPKTWVLRKIKV